MATLKITFVEIIEKYFIVQDFEKRIMPILNVFADFRENVRAEARKLKGEIHYNLEHFFFF